MPALDQLIDELRGEGVVDSKGRFTLDPERAREKMRRFQLADPRRYVLELVQAAKLRGASTIDFRIDADDMFMRFDGRPFRADELKNLYASLFADGDDSDDLRATRQLALGINAAMGMEPKWARIHSGEVVMDLHVDGADSVNTGAGVEAIEGTQIHVKQRLRAQVVVDFFRNMIARLGEERHIERRCAFAGIRITLDGRTIADGRRGLPEALVWAPISGAGYAGSVGYVVGATKGELRLLKDGVWISSHALADELPEIVVVLEDSRLRKDVSQAKIVEDDAFRRLLGFVIEARWHLLKVLYARADVIPPPGSEGLSFWQRWLDHYATADTLRQVPMLRRLAESVTWPSARGPEREVSLVELTAAVEREGHMLFSRQRVAELTELAMPTPVLTNAADVRWLRQIFGVAEVLVVDLERELKRQRAEEVFRSRRRLLELAPQVSTLATTVLTGPYRGEVGLVEDLHGAVFWLVKEGALLVKREINLPMRGLAFVVEADFMPTEFFDGVVLDRAFAEIMLDLLASAADVFALAMQSCEGERQSTALALGKRYLAAIFSEDATEVALRRIGFRRGRQGREMIEDLKTRLVPRLGIGRCPGEQVHALAHSPLFRTVGGQRCSMVEIAEIIKSTGSLRVIDREFKLLADDVSCLLVGRGDRRILAEIFGSEVMIDAWEPVPSGASRSEHVRERTVVNGADSRRQPSKSLPEGQQARRLSSRPAAPEVPEIPEHEVIVTASLSADRAEGQIGLSRRLEPVLVLELCTLGRHIGTYELPANAPLRAFFIDPKLPLLTTGEVDLESKRVAQLARWCRRRVPALLVDAAPQWGSLSAEDRAALWAHMRLLFLDPRARNGKRSQAAWRAMCSLPLFPDVGAKLWSLDALEPHTSGGRALRWLVEPLPGESVGDRPVLVLDDDQRECLAGIFDLESFEDGWRQEQVLFEQLGHVPTLQDRAPEGAIVSLQSKAALGLECTLWLPSELREDLQVDFGFGDRVFGSTGLSAYLLGAGAVRCPAVLDIDALEHRVKVSLEKQLVGLYVSLCARYGAGRLRKDLRPTALAYLQRAARAFEVATQDLTRWQLRARDSIAKVLPSRSASETREVSETREARETHELRGGVREESKHSGEVPVVFGVVAATGSAEEGLLRALSAELQLICMHSSGLLRGQELGLCSSRGDHLAAAAEYGFEINSRHPLVALALCEVNERGWISPIVLAALTSGIYTVINWRHEQISDDHERRFVRELAERLNGLRGD